jgi:hypothetical protein
MTNRWVEQAAADPKERPRIYRERESKRQGDVEEIRCIRRLCECIAPRGRCWGRSVGDLGSGEGHEQEHKGAAKLAAKGDKLVADTVGDGISSSTCFIVWCSAGIREWEDGSALFWHSLDIFLLRVVSMETVRLNVRASCTALTRFLVVDACEHSVLFTSRSLAARKVYSIVLGGLASDDVA